MWQNRGTMWVPGRGAQHLQLCQQHWSSPSQPWDMGGDWRSGPDPGLISRGCYTNGSFSKRFIQILPSIFNLLVSGSPFVQDTPSWSIFTVVCYKMSPKLPWEQLALMMCIFNLSSILIYDNIDGTVPSQDPEGVRWLKIIHLTTELNNWEPQERSHFSSVQITGDNLGQFLLGMHIFASPKSASHHIGLIRRDNKETKKVSLYLRRWWKEKGRWAGESSISWQTCRRWCRPRRRIDSNAPSPSESKQAAPGAHSAVCWDSAARTTCGFLSESCLCPQWHTESEGTEMRHACLFLTSQGTKSTGLLCPPLH